MCVFVYSPALPLWYTLYKRGCCFTRVNTKPDTVPGTTVEAFDDLLNEREKIISSYETKEGYLKDEQWTGHKALHCLISAINHLWTNGGKIVK